MTAEKGLGGGRGYRIWHKRGKAPCKYRRGFRSDISKRRLKGKWAGEGAVIPGKKTNLTNQIIIILNARLERHSF